MSDFERFFTTAARAFSKEDVIVSLKAQSKGQVTVRAKERTLEQWRLLGKISPLGEISKSTSTKLINP